MLKKRQLRSADKQEFRQERDTSSRFLQLTREQELVQDGTSSSRVDESAYGYERHEVAIQIGGVCQTQVDRFWMSIPLQTVCSFSAINIGGRSSTSESISSHKIEIQKNTDTTRRSNARRPSRRSGTDRGKLSVRWYFAIDLFMSVGGLIFRSDTESVEAWRCVIFSWIRRSWSTWEGWKTLWLSFKKSQWDPFQTSRNETSWWKDFANESELQKHFVRIAARLTSYKKIRDDFDSRADSTRFDGQRLSEQRIPE